MSQPQLSEEIIYLRDAYREVVFHPRRPGPHPANYPTENWKILFRYYNNHSGSHLGMGCQPCYGKVYEYVTRVLQNLKVIPDELQPKAGGGDN